MFEVALAKTHPELGFFQGRKIFGQRLQFLMVHAVDVVSTNSVRTGKRLLQRHRRRDNKFAVFPMFAFCSHFTNVNLGIEVRCEGITMVAAIHVNDVERMDLIEIMLGYPRGKYVGGTRIKA